MKHIPRPGRYSVSAALAFLALVLSRPILAETPTESTSGFATTGNDPFAMGETVAFAGLSLGVFNGVYGSVSIPPLYAGVDYAFHKYMTLGGIFAFSRYDYYRENLTYLTFAARGTFHPTFWLQRVKVPIDPYGIATIGYTVGSYSGPSSYRSNYSYPVIGPGVGIRYWFNPHWSGQAETGVGSGLGLASVAIAYKL